MTSRIEVPIGRHERSDRDLVASFAADVQYYLAQQPRQLPSRYLYDDLGSALFDAICYLPWYGITRAEQRLLAEHGEEVFQRAGDVSTIVELGSGSGAKLRTLVEAGETASQRAHVHLVDLSAAALESSVRTLAAFEHMRVTPHLARYEDGLAEATSHAGERGRLLLLFLGSNIGNFDPPSAEAFLHGARSRLRRGDSILLGADLVKPREQLMLAYDDPLKVTAAFNRNLLVRINRELGGNFDIDAFDHRAFWNEQDSRVEMHLLCRTGQVVRIPGADTEFSMEPGDEIWTESSYKYEPGGITALLERAGFRVTEMWNDHRARFALTLAEAA